MNNSSKFISCAEAKEIDMVNYLKSLGFEPTRISRHHYWYLSPFRNERTASFKVNRNWNCWYDFGEGKGGNLIDFGIRYFNCSVSQFLSILNDPFSNGQLTPTATAIEVKEKEESIYINSIADITSPALLYYFNKRRIDIEVAQLFCKEIVFSLYNKNYYAIGFKNNFNGYELRNEFFKGGSQPKGFTTIDNGADTICVFEGFFDFLSYMTITKNSEWITENFLILNSLSFIHAAKPALCSHQQIRLFLDRDTSGQNATKELIQLNSNIKDESHLYQHHKDLNEWLMHFGLSQKIIPQALNNRTE